MQATCGWSNDSISDLWNKAKGKAQLWAHQAGIIVWSRSFCGDNRL